MAIFKRKLDASKQTGLLNEPKCAKCKQPIFISWKDQSSMDKLGVNTRNLGEPTLFPPKEGTHGWYHMSDPQHKNSEHEATPHDGRTLMEQHNSDQDAHLAFESYKSWRSQPHISAQVEEAKHLNPQQFKKRR
jgi:hypothetical protein